MEFYYGNRYDVVYSVGFILPSVNILFVKIPSTYVAVVIDTEILLLMLWLLLSKILFYLVQHNTCILFKKYLSYILITIYLWVLSCCDILYLQMNLLTKPIDKAFVYMEQENK